MTEKEQQFNQWFDQYANGVKVFEEADMKQAYLQGRADLEKENAELKEINTYTLSQLNLDNGELIIENEKLQKENAELKMKIYGGGYEMIITKKDADIILLEKQLKEQKEHHKSVCENLTNTHRNIRYQLTKAKELLKQWLQTSKASGCDNFNIVSDTEQFLKEVEK